MLIEKKEIKLHHCVIPILTLLFLLIFGLVIYPQVFNEPTFPLEIIFITASVISVVQLLYLGFSWKEIQDSMVNKLSQAMPAIFILFCIGILIGSWIISGTIPMLIYYGIKIINPKVLYLVAFIVPAIFATFTGTSWGSVGTIGVVILGIAGVVNGSLPITAGAIVAGAYLGDKMSPLSDTTNIAALATEVDLYDHIRSMMNTTFPSAAIAAILYLTMGFIYTPTLGAGGDMSEVQVTLNALQSLFNFNIFLLIPIAIVLYGAITKKPTVPTLILSSFVAGLMGLVFQGFTQSDIAITLNKGFDIGMLRNVSGEIPENIITILNRGGLYNLIDSIIICMTVFVFVGTLDLTDALPRVIHKLFGHVKKRSTTILAALGATAITNAMTSNQFATSFLIGGAFKTKFDELKIPRKVLSRSLEDTGTMLENMLPWTTTGVFMTIALGISPAVYWKWQFLALGNYTIAVILAITGIGCFYHEEEKKLSKLRRKKEKQNQLDAV
jgi:Na+:H+ antiporter, NhaC family